MRYLAQDADNSARRQIILRKGPGRDLHRYDQPPAGAEMVTSAPTGFPIYFIVVALRLCCRTGGCLTML